VSHVYVSCHDVTQGGGRLGGWRLLCLLQKNCALYIFLEKNCALYIFHMCVCLRERACVCACVCICTCTTAYVYKYLFACVDILNGCFLGV